MNNVFESKPVIFQAIIRPILNHPESNKYNSNEEYQVISTQGSKSVHILPYPMSGNLLNKNVLFNKDVNSKILKHSKFLQFDLVQDQKDDLKLEYLTDSLRNEVIKGKNTSVLSYGCSDSGKSTFLRGQKKSYQQGLISNISKLVFKKGYNCFVSVFQIHKEFLYDCLDNQENDIQYEKLSCQKAISLKQLSGIIQQSLEYRKIKGNNQINPRNTIYGILLNWTYDDKIHKFYHQIERIDKISTSFIELPQSNFIQSQQTSPHIKEWLNYTFDNLFDFLIWKFSINGKSIKEKSLLVKYIQQSDNILFSLHLIPENDKENQEKYCSQLIRMIECNQEISRSNSKSPVKTIPQTSKNKYSKSNDIERKTSKCNIKDNFSISNNKIKTRKNQYNQNIDFDEIEVQKIRNREQKELINELKIEIQNLKNKYLDLKNDQNQPFTLKKFKQLQVKVNYQIVFEILNNKFNKNNKKIQIYQKQINYQKQKIKNQKLKIENSNYQINRKIKFYLKNNQIQINYKIFNKNKMRILHYKIRKQFAYQQGYIIRRKQKFLKYDSKIKKQFRRFKFYNLRKRQKIDRK